MEKGVFSMVRKRDDIKEQLTKNENFLTAEDQSEAENQGNARKDSKEKESTNTKEYRKKKKDALQGKERRV